MQTVEYYLNLLDLDWSQDFLNNFVKTEGEPEIKIKEFINELEKIVPDSNLIEYLYILLMQFQEGVINFKFFFTLFAEIMNHHTDYGGKQKLLMSCGSDYSIFIRELSVIMRRVLQNEDSVLYKFLRWAIVFEEYNILPRKHVDVVLMRYLQSKLANPEVLLSEAIKVKDVKISTRKIEIESI